VHANIRRTMQREHDEQRSNQVHQAAAPKECAAIEACMASQRPWQKQLADLIHAVILVESH
jgi:predicted NAD-dependent protein-ADP-ribosyltransferase YbiA (DUF1768 family)